MVRKAVIGVAIAGAAMLGGGLYAQAGGKTVWDGIYSEAQATAGGALYNENCAACHGVSLGGTGEAPTLSGAEFIATWNGLTVGDLFDRIRTTMPFDRPGALTRDQYAQVVAYVLKFNGYPAGQSDMSGRSEMLATIKMLSQKPAATADASRAMPAGAVHAMALQAAAPAAAATMQAQQQAAQTQNWPRVDMALPHNAYPNPYKAADANFLKLPAGRVMGSSSTVATDSKGNIWVAERCGANNCATSDIDPIMQFDRNGNFIKAFGGGMFAFPHGMYIDAQDNIWLTDERAANGKGSTVTKFSPDGKVLMQLGKPGVAEDGQYTFLEPNAALVAPNGDIFVASGHENGKPATIKKYDRNGKFLTQWGTTGAGQGQLNVPHALAMDSKGRLFVADRWNDRIQIYDQNGKLLDSWTQFGRPSGLYIDRNDIVYSADSESRFPPGYGYHPNWARGIRIGSARTGQVQYFIPDTFDRPNATATSGEEGVWAGPDGTVWGAQVQQRRIVRYTR